MFQTKRLVRLTACFLIACLCVMPVHAQENEEPAPTAEAVEAEAVKPATHAVSAVHFSPSYGSTVIGNLENGTVVTILGFSGSFYKIHCYDRAGFIDMAQVAKNENGEYYINCVEGSSETTIMQSYTPQEALTLKGELREIAMQYIGVRYVSGGTSPYGFDCSGLTQYVFAQKGISLYRTVAGQLQNGILIPKEELQCGDLIVFQNTTGWGHFASHVGIYIGNNQVLHAGNSGVGITELDHPYITQHYQSAIRVILTDVVQEEVAPVIGIHQNMNSSFWRESSQTDVSGNFFSNSIETEV